MIPLKNKLYDIFEEISGEVVEDILKESMEKLLMYSMQHFLKESFEKFLEVFLVVSLEKSLEKHLKQYLKKIFEEIFGRFFERIHGIRGKFSEVQELEFLKRFWIFLKIFFEKKICQGITEEISEKFSRGISERSIDES